MEKLAFNLSVSLAIVAVLILVCATSSKLAGIVSACSQRISTATQRPARPLAFFLSRVAGWINVPVLVMFLAVGMLAGSEGFGGIHYDDAFSANIIGTVAMAFILYSGGYDTRWKSIRSVIGYGSVLSSIGVLLTVPAKALLNKLYAKGIVKKRIVNNYMMDRISGFAFDVMIVAGVAAIQLPLLADYWLVLLLLAVYGTVVTFLYVNFVCKKMFPAYRHEQFLAFFGMLTGTASTGMILLREIDGSYRTPASENLVYQTLPAIVFGFPLMFLAPYAATSDLAALITCIVVGVCFVVLNVLLFRRSIFKKQYARAAAKRAAADGNEVPSPEDADTGASDELSDGADMGAPDDAPSAPPADTPPSE